MENKQQDAQTSIFGRNRHFTKALIIGALSFLLIIPTWMIQSLVSERQSRQEEATTEVGAKWGGQQTITGPILTIPYISSEKDDSNRIIKVTRYAHFLPEDLTINGELMPEKRYRSFYEVVVYNSKIHFDGNYAPIDNQVLNIAKENMLLKDAYICLGITDLRGIEEQIKLNWNATTSYFNSGVTSNDVMTTGINAVIPLSIDGVSNFKFSFDLTLKGSQKIFFAPVGKETKVTLKSKWDSPSFDGAFLPDSREVNPTTGFTAFWKVLHLNRKYPQSWLGANNDIDQTTFGVNLFLPTDHYKKTMRTAKYAFLLIILTFLVFFFVEILQRQAVHPFQYLLIGLALCVFFALLLAFSEHINFNIAYGIASVMTIGLITVYTWSILKDRRLATMIGGVLVILYGFIFTIVQLKDYALLIGSIGIFVALSLVMYLSRQIDWYDLNDEKANN